MKLEGQEICQTCGGSKVLRQVHGYPIATQIFFGGSFIAFLIWSDKVRENFGSWALWTWTVIQLLLAMLLVRQRILAKRLVYRCIRCDAALR